MANAEKFLDKKGVKALWEQIHNTFAHQADYELDKAGIDYNLDFIMEGDGGEWYCSVPKGTLFFVPFSQPFLFPAITSCLRQSS